MNNQQDRPARQQFDSRMQLQVEGRQEIEELYAANLSEGGLFIRHDRPPPAGCMVLIEFVLPDGSPLCRAAGRVAHSRPAVTPGEKSAGMGVEFAELDEIAQEIVEAFRARTGRPVATAEESSTPVCHTLTLSNTTAQRALLPREGPVVGIDFGTVNSCVSVVEEGRPKVIGSSDGYEIIPSVVFLGQRGNVFVGHKALERMILEPSRAIYGSKRFLGRPYASKEVCTQGHFFNYDLVEGPDGRTAARVGDRVLTLEQVASYVLRTLRTMATRALKRDVNRAVVTVPAYFGETQRQAVRDAGRLAGLHVERLISEPTAAAVAYGHGRNLQRTIMAYDLGGGTFDVSVLRINGATMEVLATDGDPFLGGSDFDDRLTEYVIASFERQSGINLRHDPVAVQRVRFAAEMCKHQLTEAESATLDLPYVAQVDGTNVALYVKLRRDLLETLTQDLVDRTFNIVDGVLKTADLHAVDLDDVVLVGGQTRSPHVRRTLMERFGRKPSTGVHPDHAVAMGAAIVADVMHATKPVHLTDILPASIRLGLTDGTTTVLLPRGTRLPASKQLEITGHGDTLAGRLVLCRGETERTVDNTSVGALSLPPNFIAVLCQHPVTLTVTVSADGLLSVTVRHPVTEETQDLDISLTEVPDEAR